MSPSVKRATDSTNESPIIYRINEAKRVVEIHSIRHRRDVYRF